MNKKQYTFIQFCVLVVTLLLIGCAERQEGASPYGPGGNVLAYLGSTPVLGTAKDVDVFDTLAYVADEYYGVSIYDISNPFNPQLIDTIELQSNQWKARLIKVDSTGRIAAVESGNGMQIFDLHNDKEYLGVNGSFGHYEFELYFEEGTLTIIRCDKDDGFNYEIFFNQGTLENPSYTFGIPNFYSRYKESYTIYGF